MNLVEALCLPRWMLRMTPERLPWFVRLCLFLCLIVAVVGWANPFGFRVIFESARMQGLVFHCWLVLSWCCLAMVIKYGPLWLKLTVPAIVVVPLLFVSAFGWTDAEELVKSNIDRTISVTQRTALDSRTTRVRYDYEPGPMCQGGLMERTEVSIVPGILLIYDCHKVLN